MISPEEVKQGARSQYSDNMPYNSTAYDGAMNRALKQCGAGSAWSGRSVQTFYYVNTGTGSLSCAKYELSGKQLIRKGLYDTGDLVVVRTIDEDGHSRYDFSDKEGHTVLSRQINGGNYDAYYVYDDYGDLRYVLPPLAADQLNSNNIAYNIDNTQALIDYAYYYEYDNYGNCTMKKKPGAEKELFFYDKDHRLILSQNGVQRFHKDYTFYFYDIYGREVLRGTCTCSTPENIKNQSIVAAYTGEEESSILKSGYAVTNLPFANNNLLLENINYYDDYSFFALSGFKKGEYSYESLYDFDNLYMHPTNDKLSAKGLLTGSVAGRFQSARVLMVGSIDGTIPDRYYNAYYYNEDAQIIQSVASNHLDGYERNYFKYSFTGKLLKHLHEHSAKDKGTIRELHTYTYDRANRLSTTSYSLNDATPVVLSSLSYDNIGRLKNKTLNNGKIPVSYAYNIRGWLTGIQSGTFYENLYYNTSLSGSTLYYNGNISAIQWGNSSHVKQFSQYKYDGLNRLISSSFHNSEISEVQTDKVPDFSEEFSYDKHGNITSLTHYGIVGEIFSASNPGTLLPSHDYRYGKINQLTFSYQGNQLKRVQNAISLSPMIEGTYYFPDKADKSVEYTYDANGNMISDLNKELKSVSYTNLNLPKSLSFSSGKSNKYQYDALGNKLRMSHWVSTDLIFHPVLTSSLGSRDSLSVVVPKPPVTINTAIDKTDYCGNIIYENGTLSKILTDEGFVSFVDNTPTYYFYIKDHQGNNRILTKSSVLYAKKYDYYAFGGVYNNNSESQEVSPVGPIKPAAISQNYLFGGKEIDRMNGLDWYDFGARAQDPLLGRFMSIDPLCEKYYSISPYVYCNNNPIKYVDPSGMFYSTEVELNEDNTYTVVGGKADGDLNIYVTENGERTGEVIGQSLTEYSFLDDNGTAVNGAIIDPQDQSGMDFISNQIVGDNPNIFHYMPNATKKKKYDFKTLGMPNNFTSKKQKRQYCYRGMPFNNKKIYASARDIGNWGAGYVAGKSGLS